MNPHLRWAGAVLALFAVFCACPAPALGQPPHPVTGSGKYLSAQIGVFLASTGRSDPREAMQAVKSLGLDMIQVSRLPDRYYTPEGAREFGALMRETGLHASAVVVVFSGESYKDQDAVRATVGFRPAQLIDQRVAHARRCVDFAAALHVKIVTFHVGFSPGDSSDPDYRRMLDAVSNVAAYATRKRVTISLETGQETAAELVRFIEQIKGARVGVNFDVANLVLYGIEDPPAALRALLPRVTSVHLKDALPPPDSHQLGTEVRLGEGKAQVKTCLRILMDAGFRGPLVIENYVWRRGTDPLGELEKAKRFTQSTLAEIASPAPDQRRESPQ
jgi:sugar phosphate isomerase/epimerase